MLVGAHVISVFAVLVALAAGGCIARTVVLRWRENERADRELWRDLFGEPTTMRRTVLFDQAADLARAEFQPDTDTAKR